MVSPQRLARLRRDVEQMTHLLHQGPTLKGLRIHLKSKGVDPEACLMGGFMEDEEHGEYGLVVTPQCRLIWYERNTLSNELRKWTVHTAAVGLSSMFREAEVAYSMMKERAGNRVQTTKPTPRAAPKRTPRRKR
jgi:hypothetical protein